ncbi:BQ2448_4216 [Microbotryum intermedium]|uniref:BQ2448_4216 protein n=1 Tax=Microbotryum intermedium TaxID=269621 RepID=A0A238FIQ9_9BASI|nr:BQ2448_4216 [Microbotryum intermedium]
MVVASSAAVAHAIKAEPVEESASLLQRLSSPTALQARVPDGSNHTASLSTSVPGIASTSTASTPQREEGLQATNKPVVPGTAAAGGQILTGGVNPQKIYIGNLPQSATLADLEDCFGQFGPCTCAIKRGFGFAEFASPEHAKAAVAKYHQGHFLGSQITVQLSHERIYLGKKSDNSKETRTPPSPAKASQVSPVPASRSMASDKLGGSRTKQVYYPPCERTPKCSETPFLTRLVAFLHIRGKDKTDPSPKPKTTPISSTAMEPIETLPPLRFVMDHVGPPAQTAVPPPQQLSPGVYERSDRYVPVLSGPGPTVHRTRAVGSADEVPAAFTSGYPEAYDPAPAYNPEPVPRFDHRADPYVHPRTATAAAPRPLEYAYRAHVDAYPYQQHPPPSSYDRNPPPESLYGCDRASSAPVRDAVPYPPFPDRPRFPSRSDPLPTSLRAPSPPPPAAYYAAPLPQQYPPRELPASRQYSYQHPNHPLSRDYDDFDRYDPRRPTASHPYESHAYLSAGLPQTLPPCDRDEGRHDARAGPVRDYARDAARYQPYGRSLPPPSQLTLNPSTSTVRDSPFGAVGTPVPHASDSKYTRAAGDERRYVDSPYGARAPVDHDWPDWGASYTRR